MARSSLSRFFCCSITSRRDFLRTGWIATFCCTLVLFLITQYDSFQLHTLSHQAQWAAAIETTIPTVLHKAVAVAGAGHGQTTKSPHNASRIAERLKKEFEEHRLAGSSARFFKDNLLKDYYSRMPTLSSRMGETPQVGGATLSSEDQQALQWANEHPNDPRSAQIKQRLGVR